MSTVFTLDALTTSSAHSDGPSCLSVPQYALGEGAGVGKGVSLVTVEPVIVIEITGDTNDAGMSGKFPASLTIVIWLNNSDMIST